MYGLKYINTETLFLYLEIQRTFIELRYFKENSTLVKMADNRVSSEWPPTLERDANYEAWKKDIQMWCHLTDY